MELDLGWLLIGLPLVFALGWVASRLDLRQLRFESRSAPKAYFKGLNYLLTEHQDKAIDAFIEAVRRDPDTAELHFALGNLFRRRGEYDRAVRVLAHEPRQGLADRGGVIALLREHDERQRAGTYRASEGCPEAVELVQNRVRAERAHYGFLHACPRRASISSAALGPQVPAG